MPITSSSTSSSDVSARSWRRWLAGVVAAITILPTALLGLLVLADPYDSGRFGSILGAGVPPQGSRTAHASRVRDSLFDAAIIGNSHVQPLSPERLSAATGMRFVSLTAPGAGLAEQEALLRRFAAERGERARAVVIGVDTYTCHSGPRLQRTGPFPFWLYAEDRLGYVAGLFRFAAVEAAVRRAFVLATGGPLARRDGWWDYEEGRSWGPAVADTLRRSAPLPLASGPGPFAGVDALSAMLAALPATTRVVLLVPPVFAGALPASDSPAADDARRCRERLAAVAAARAGTVVIDRRVDSALTRDPRSFWDASHYAGPVAQWLEAQIAQAIGLP